MPTDAFCINIIFFTMEMTKYQLGLAGEYAVCSELLKRGKHASLTMGNAKGMDVLVFDETDKNRNYKVVEVKTTQDKKFVTSFFNKYYDRTQPHPDVWVLVHIDEQLQTQFYVLTHEELGEIQMKRNKITTWEKSSGCDNVLLKDVEQFQNMWEKI